MSDFRFANPSWSLAIWMVAVLVLALVWLDERGRASFGRFISRVMQGRLVERLSRARRWTATVLLGLSMAALVFATMRPQWGLTYVETPRVGAQIMICLDVSKSMLAADTAPNRLERAKAEIKDMLGYLDGDQVGLIGFAGKATVMCPLTTDYGFLSLVLDEAGPQSVGRGGTRLEEPIRQAVSGFRGELEVSRIILLITDGEDHDSFPVDAAKDAAEHGIKIITIGFGDEAGSEIEIVDPETGARMTLRDREGNVVQSRLDGELLRELAMTTEGAYIPAGTGALDLESIYDAHIAPLVRGNLDGRGRAVRREGYQWALLASVVLLFTSLVVGTRRVGLVSSSPAVGNRRAALRGKSAGRRVAILILATMFFAKGAWADETEEPETEPDSRQTYNSALALLEQDVDKADKLLIEARRAARTDGEVRFRASYNLGWIEVQRCNKIVEENPLEGLEHLQTAANHFRDAIRLRPDHRDSRHNLEVVLRRIIQLNDALQKKVEKDLAGQLDELINRQRQLWSSVGGLVEGTAGESDPSSIDRYRSEFRRIAVDQRQILGDTQRTTESAHRELDALKAKKPDELQKADQLRLAQLTYLVRYASQAQQRMGQTRSQLRRSESQRAFRRAAASLIELKRARDQLRNPIEILSVILADAIALARQTQTFVSSKVPDDAAEPLPTPKWLTRDYLQDEQLQVTERTSELAERLKVVADQDATRSTNEQPPDSQTKTLLENIGKAAPLIAKAVDAFQLADGALADKSEDQVLEKQEIGIRNLMEAAELFFDMRRLIEVMYTDEKVSQLMLSQEDPALTENTELLSGALGIQDRNLDRGSRLAEQFESELERLLVQQGNGQRTPQDDQQQASQLEAQKRRLETAKEILDKVRQELTNARKELTELTQNSDPIQEDLRKESLAAAKDAATRTVDHLSELRRLFFSVVEHLRDTAQRQAQLNDETEPLAAEPDIENAQQQAGPLAERQRELESISGEIARALEQQASQPPPMQPGAAQDNQQQALAAEATRRLSEAADHVSAAQSMMNKAIKSFEEERLEPKPIRKSQDEALEELVQALSLLVPPEQPPQQNEQQSNENQNNGQQQQDDKREDEKGEADNRQLASLLQAVRDREAQRRKENARRQRVQMESVGKDW